MKCSAVILLLGSLGLGLPEQALAALSQTSYASWYSTITTDGLGHVNVYALQPNTTINLYRATADDTSIGGAPVATWVSTAANEPFHFPVAGGPNDHNVNWTLGTERSYYRLVATHATAPPGTNLVNWDLNSPSKGNYLDAHTLLVSETGTYAGSLFHTYLFYNDGNAGNNARGMSLGVINTGTTPINIQVNRWNGAAWVAAPASASGASNFAGLAADRIWMYGGVSQASMGDYQVVVSGGTALVYKGCMFELDNDNAFMMAAGPEGYKQGRVLYGAMGRTNYGPSPGNIVLTSIGGPSTVDVYTYAHSGNNALPAVPGGAWNLWAAGMAVPAGVPVSLGPNRGGLPDINGTGQFVKVVVTGGNPVQAGTGANILSGVAGDGDWIAAADTARPLGRLFYCSNGNYSNNLGLSDNNNPRIVVIAPTAGTQIRVSSPGKPDQLWTSGGIDQAHSFPIDYSNGVADENRIWTVTSSNHNVYCFFETAGTASNDMEKMYSAVAPIPGADLLVSKVASALQVEPGEQLSYTITLTNIGSEDAINAQVWDTIPAGLLFVGDTQPAFVSTPGVPGSTARVWTFPTVPANGGSVAITLTVQVDPAQPLGSRTFANSASVLAANAQPRTVAHPAISFAVAQPDACRQAWAPWESNPVSGSQLEGFLHIYAQKDGTTLTLRQASNLDAGVPPMAVNTNIITVNLDKGETYSYPGSQAASQSGGGGFATRLFKLESNYPVSWELESQNISDRMGHQMMVNSVQGRFSDNQPFYTYMDYYHKDCGGPPKCWDQTRYGDALVVVNPNTGGGQTARFQAFNSLDNGTTWVFVGDYSVAPEGALLIGGTSTLNDGDYLVLPYQNASSQGLPLIVYKGSAINRSSETQNTGALYGVSEDGTKAATAGEAIYGLAGTGSGPNIVITALAAGTTYQVWQYSPATGATPDWPITGNSGSWSNVATGGPLALGASATFTTPLDGLYKVEVTAGSAQALFGSNMFTNFQYGDGDQVASLDNQGVDWLTGQTGSVFKGRDFRFSSGPQNGGNIIVVAPNAGTTVQVTGSLNTGGGNGRSTSPNPPASTVPDQAWRFEISASNAAYRVTASDDVLVFVQDRGNDHQAKAFAGMPLVLCVVLTPTPSSTATPSATPTSTPSPTASVTASPTATPTSTPSATLTPSPSVTLTSTASATRTPSPTVTPSPTLTPSFSATDSVTPTPTPSGTQSPGPSPTQSASPSATPTGSPSSTPSPSVTSTPTLTDTPSPGPSPTATPSVTQTLVLSPTATPTVTGTPSATPTDTPSGTPTSSPSVSPTLTRTPSITASPTITQTWTEAPTPVPVPHQVRIGVYNSAGEIVKLLFAGVAQYQPGQLSVGDGIVVADGENSLALSFPGYLYDPSTAAYVTGLAWKADNDGGQPVSSGVYTLKAEIKDSFGHVTTLQKSVQVIDARPRNRLALYSSAGELVALLPLPQSGTGRFRSFRLSSEIVALEPDVGGSGATAPLTVWVMDEQGQEFPLDWDGLNSQGLPVASGSYVLQMEYIALGGGRPETLSKPLAILQASPAEALQDARAYPNPLTLGGPLQVAFTPIPGTTVSGRLYNMAGELVGGAQDLHQSGRLAISAGHLASGVYLLKLELRIGSALRASRVMKVAVLR